MEGYKQGWKINKGGYKQEENINNDGYNRNRTKTMMDIIGIEQKQ